MTKRRAITRDEIMDMAAYRAVRKEKRAQIAALKRNRRVSVGPFATFYFESYETMWMQIHEMLFIEQGGAAQIPDELAAYNPLIPQGRELLATLMFEIDDPARRTRALHRIAGIETTIRMEIGTIRVRAVPTEDEVDRTTPDGKTSAVHFLRFPFTDDAAARFKEPGNRIVLGFEHENYGHLAVVPEAVRAALAEDLD